MMRQNKAEFEEEEEIEEYFNLNKELNIVLTSKKLVVIAKQGRNYGMKCIEYSKIFELTRETKEMTVFYFQQGQKGNIKEIISSKANMKINFLRFTGENRTQESTLTKIEKLLREKMLVKNI